MKNRKAKFRQPPNYYAQQQKPEHFHPRSHRESNTHIDKFLENSKAALLETFHKIKMEELTLAD